MSRLKLGIIGALVAGLGTLWLIQHQAQIRLQEENDSLRQRLDQMDQLAAEHDRLSNLAAHTTSPLANDQLRELLRLRGEVGLLREQTNEIEKLRQDNQLLRVALATGRNPQTANPPTNAAPQFFFPKESWTFAGYDTPEAAYQTAMWAFSKRDFETYLSSFTPRMQKEIEKEKNGFAADADFRLNNTVEYRILNKEINSEDEVLLDVIGYYPNGLTVALIRGRPLMPMRRIDGKWKLGG